MKLMPNRPLIVALLATAVVLATVASAQADPGWRRWKNVGHDGRRGRESRVVFEDRHHGGAGPVLAGIIGGILIDQALRPPRPVMVETRHSAPPPPLYRYEDAWGDRWWDTIDECREAAFDPHGPRVIYIVDAQTNERVRTLYWKHDHFISDDDRGDGRD